MKISVERLPECKALVSVEIPAEDTAAERGQVVAIYSQKAKLPGFRPGKVPAKVIEKRFGEAIAGELEERFVHRAMQETASGENLNIIKVEEVRDAALNGDGSYSFVAEILHGPEFELPEYKGLEVQVPDTEVTDEHLAEAIDQMRERFADYADIEGRPAAMGDFLVIDYRGTIGGKPLGEVAPNAPASLAQNSGFWLRMAEDTFLPGFCLGLVGAAKGDIKEVQVTVPGDFPDEAVRGQVIDYKVEVNDLKEQVLPEVDDEFAGKVEEGKTLDQLKESLRERMAQHREQQKREMITNQLVDKLASSVDFELPKEIVAAETQNRVDEIVNSNAQRGLAEDEIVKHQDEIIQAAGQQAALTVKTNYILGKVAEAEGIEVSKEEILTQVAQIAAAQGVPPKKALKQIEKNNGFGRIQNSIRFRKTLDFIRENAVVNVVDAPAGPAAGQ